MKKLTSIAFGLLLTSLLFASNDKKEGKATSTKVELIDVAGKVVDALSGEPISGAEVKVEGISTYTDINGNYFLKVSNTNPTITISFISFEDQKMDLNTLIETKNIELK